MRPGAIVAHNILLIWLGTSVPPLPRTGTRLLSSFILPVAIKVVGEYVCRKALWIPCLTPSLEILCIFTDILHMKAIIFQYDLSRVEVCYLLPEVAVGRTPPELVLKDSISNGGVDIVIVLGELCLE